MRTLGLLSLLALAIAAPAIAQSRVNERRPAARDASIKIFNLAGYTRIIGWDRDSIAVTGTVSRNAGRLTIGLAGDGRSIRIGLDAPVDERNTEGAALEIRVPAGARVLARSATASIEVSDVTGALELNSVSGGIVVSGRPRELYVETLEGNVDLRVVSPAVRAKTAGGGIALRVTGEELDAATVSGDIAVEGGRYRRGRFQTVTGNIRFSGGFDRLGNYGFETQSGGVELLLTVPVFADFDILSERGTIDDGFRGDGVIRPAPDGPARFVFSTDPGAAQVTVRTFKGTVTLRKVPRG